MPESYLLFNQLAAAGSTERWSVVSARRGDRLGTVRWHGAWRQYVFEPWPATIFSRGCLEEVNGVLEQLTREFRESRRAINGQG